MGEAKPPVSAICLMLALSFRRANSWEPTSCGGELQLQNAARSNSAVEELVARFLDIGVDQVLKVFLTT